MHKVMSDFDREAAIWPPRPSSQTATLWDFY